MTAEGWERVKDLFDELADSAPDRCAAVLSQEDEEIRSEVQRLLANHQAAAATESPLDRPLLSANHLMREAFRELRVFEPGELLLNRFEIRGFIGAGGMGEVYEAYDPLLSELVALKTVRYDLQFDLPVVQRFRMEVQRARRVTHPNVCRVHDLFHIEEETGRHITFFTMELLRGVTLFDRVKDAAPDGPEMFAIATQICDGLEAAHRAGIIHRDLKSGNVLLVPRTDLVPRAVITDFGLAHGVSDPDDTTVNLSGCEIRGTPPYLAPELFEGREATVQTDIYALGVLFFRMATGEYPFPRTEDAKLASLQRMRPPDPRHWNHSLDRVWAATILECLAPDPRQRPGSAAVVARKLRRDGGVTRRALVMGAAGVAGASGVYVLRTRKPAPQERQALLVGPFSGNQLGSAVSGLFRLLLSSPSSNVDLMKQGESKGTPVWHLAGEIKAVGQTIEIRTWLTEIATRKRIRSMTTRASGPADLARGVSAAAVGLSLLPADAVASVRVANIPLAEIDTANPAALGDVVAGLVEYSDGNLELALRLLERAASADREFALAYVYRALILTTLRREHLGIEQAERALSFKTRLTPRSRPHAEAIYHYLCGDLSSALAKWSEVARLYPTEAPLQRHVGQMYTLLGRHGEALTHVKNAIALESGSPQNLMMLACAYADLADFTNAEAVLRDAEKSHRDSALIGAAKGYIALLAGKTDEAISEYEKVAAKAELEGMARSFQYRALMLGGRLEEAKRRIRLRFAVIRQENDITNDDMCRYWLAWLLLLEGDRQGALEQVSALASRDAVPTSLFALRAASEISAEAGNGLLCREVEGKVRRIAERYPSRRMSGILCQCTALERMASGNVREGRALLDQAEEYWKDIHILWASAQASRRERDWPSARSRYVEIIGRRPTALRLEGVIQWVLASGMTGLCSHAAGNFNEAVPFYKQFLYHWGTQSQLSVVRQIHAALDGARLPTEVAN